MECFLDRAAQYHLSIPFAQLSLAKWMVLGSTTRTLNEFAIEMVRAVIEQVVLFGGLLHSVWICGRSKRA